MKQELRAEMTQYWFKRLAPAIKIMDLNAYQAEERIYEEAACEARFCLEVLGQLLTGEIGKCNASS